MITVTDLITDPDTYHSRTQRPRRYGPVRLGPVLSPEMTLDDQLRRATLANANAHSSTGHDQLDLWTWASECGHPTPDDDPTFDDVDDLLDNAMKGVTLTWKDGDPYYAKLSEMKATIPRYVEYEVALEAYDAVHGDGVCRDQPQGSCCIGCTEGDDDSGYEPGSCIRQELARETYSDFWYANGNAAMRTTTEVAAA